MYVSKNTHLSFWKEHDLIASMVAIEHFSANFPERQIHSAPFISTLFVPDSSGDRVPFLTTSWNEIIPYHFSQFPRFTHLFGASMIYAKENQEQ